MKLWFLLLLLTTNPLNITLLGVEYSGSQSVRVAVTIDDPAIQELRPESIKAWIDEQPVTINTVTTISTTPQSPTLEFSNGQLQAKSISIGIVVDLSTLLDPVAARGLARQWLEFGRHATKDRIALFIPPTVTGQLAPVPAFTTDRNRILNELDQHTPNEGATQLNATIQQALDATYHNAAQHAGIGYVVVISDGGDSASPPMINPQQTVPLIALRIGPEIQRYAAQFQALTAATNGRYLPDLDPIILQSQYNELAHKAQVHGFSLEVSDLPEGSVLRIEIRPDSRQPTSLEIPLNAPQAPRSTLHILMRYWLIALPSMGLLALLGAKGGPR